MTAISTPARAAQKPGQVKPIADRPRKLSYGLSPIRHEGTRARHLSPLRYPGAKAGLADVLRVLFRNATDTAGIKIELLVEPFAGGASTSLRLLADGLVERALLADADPMVAAFWQVAAADTEALVARMREEHETFVSRGGRTALGRWDHWKRWQPQPGTSPHTERFDLAVRCLFLNRTTFSGIMHGNAGPIGGRAQTSPYGIGCRFNPDDLAQRIRLIGHLYETGRIADVWRADWRATMDEVASAYKTLVPDNVIAYLDPPYLDKSHRLYATTFDRAAFPHLLLANYLRRKARYRWVLSYDAHPDLLGPDHYGWRRMIPDPETGVRGWYASTRIVDLNYCASAREGRGIRRELLVTTLPRSTVPSGGAFGSVIE